MAGSSIIEIKPVSEIEGLSCAQLALMAATGKSRAEVDAALLRAAELDKVPLDFKTINSRIWRRAVQLLGYVVVRDDEPEPQPNVDQFMAANDHRDVLLVVIQAPEEPDNDHVFAAEGDRVVDFYTEGRVEKYDSTKNSLRKSRVIHTVHVRRAPNNYPGC